MAASCEKMNLDDSGEAGVPNVVVSISSMEQVPFGAATRAAQVGDVGTRLNVAVYNSEGTRVAQVNQMAGDEDFGRAGFHLPEGRYFLVALAHGSSRNPTMTNARKIQFSNQKEGIGYSDTFLYGDSLLVGAEPVSRSLALRRIVAKVRFEFDDTPPEAASRVRFYYEGGSGAVDAASGWGVVKSKQAQYYAVDHDTRQYEIYTIPRADEGYLTVTVTCYQPVDDGEQPVCEKRIDSIPITRNRITVCRGRLFDGESVATRSSSFSFTVEDEWEEGETVFF